MVEGQQRDQFHRQRGRTKMNRPRPREPLIQNFFGLSESQAQKRAQWIFIFNGLLWIILSGLEILIHFYYADQRSLVIVLMSFVKYAPILFVPFIAARKIASEYLTDIFELSDEGVAEDFISNLALGSGHETITIDNGRVKDDDLNSPLLLIGGPGYVQVNLGNAAVTEKTDGEPNILYSQPDYWKLEGFERIREIGFEDGKPRYAVFDLKDQFIRNLSIATRTKDGIPIEALDIKIIFSVQRRPDAGDNGDFNDSIAASDEAIHALVYRQTVPAGTTKSFHPRVGFPWDSTILPLVLGELEDLIMGHSLNEILADIGRKEREQISDADNHIDNLKKELTGQHPAANTAIELHSKLQNNKVNIESSFQSRSKITARFYEAEFQKKARNLGVNLIWIDIGTWKLPPSVVLEKHREAWNLARENAEKRAGILRKKDAAKRKEFMQLVNDVMFSQIERAFSLKDFSDISATKIDLKKLAERKPPQIARDILRAFRKELVSALDLYASDKQAYDKNRQIAEAIERAIAEINHHLEPHPGR